MNVVQLTGAVPAARSPAMHSPLRPRSHSAARRPGALAAILSGSLGLAALSGCVQVSAPDKPIVIELNINIRQEVIYRLAEDAKNTIEENKGVF